MPDPCDVGLSRWCCRSSAPHSHQCCLAGHQGVIGCASWTALRGRATFWTAEQDSGCTAGSSVPRRRYPRFGCPAGATGAWPASYQASDTCSTPILNHPRQVIHAAHQYSMIIERITMTPPGNGAFCPQQKCHCIQSVLLWCAAMDRQDLTCPLKTCQYTMYVTVSQVIITRSDYAVSFVLEACGQAR